MTDELELQESELASARVPRGCQRLVLVNAARTDVDDEAIAADLARLDGAGVIRALVVRPSSRLKRLRFLAALSGLESLQVYGLALESLDGLAGFRHGRVLEIDTGRNHRRDLSALGDAPITKLILRWAGPADLDAVARCANLRELVVTSCPPLLLERWASLPLESLALHRGTLDRLADTRQLAALTTLTLHGCRRLERLEGDNGNVRWMAIIACSKLDVRTIASFTGVSFLRITGPGDPARLSAFTGLSQLRRLVLRDREVAVDAEDLGSLAGLETLEIGKLGRSDAERLSRANPGPVITNGTFAYRGGAPVERP